MDNELLRNIFGPYSQSNFISREIDRQIALLREQSERHVFVDGGRIYNTTDDRNVSIWHDGSQESLNYQGRHLVDTLTEQLLGKVEMINDSIKTKEEKTKEESDEELELMKREIFRVIPELENNPDVISYENISTRYKRFDYKLTYVNLYINIENFNYELGLIFIFNKRLKIKNFIIDSCKSENKNNVELYFKKYYSKEITNKKNKALMFPKKYVEDIYPINTRKELPKGYLLNINRDLKMNSNGTVNKKIFLTIGMDKNLFNKKIKEWEGKQLTIGEKYEVQRYMTFSLEYFKNKIGIPDMKSSFFNKNSNVTNSIYNKISDIIIRTPANSPSIDFDIKEKYNDLISVKNNKYLFLTSAKNIEILEEKNNQYIIRLEVNELYLDEDIIDLNVNYLEGLHVFNYIDNKKIDKPMLPKIE